MRPSYSHSEGNRKRAPKVVPTKNQGMEQNPPKPPFGPFINFFELEEGVLHSADLCMVHPITSVTILKCVPHPADAEVAYLFQADKRLGQFTNTLIDQD
jgi:hypothetical protein